MKPMVSSNEKAAMQPLVLNWNTINAKRVSVGGSIEGKANFTSYFRGTPTLAINIFKQYVESAMQKCTCMQNACVYTYIYIYI